MEPHELSSSLVHQRHPTEDFIIANGSEDEDDEEANVEEGKPQQPQLQLQQPHQAHPPHSRQTEGEGTVGTDGQESPTPAKGAPVLPTKPKSWRKVFFLVLVFTSVWWMAAILVIMQIKQTVVSDGIFPYPFALTSIVQPTTGLAAWLLSLVVHRKRRPAPPFTWSEVGMMFALGGMQGFEIGLTNKALEYLSVAGRTMISSTGVLFMMATARMWGLERLGLLRILSALLLLAGGLTQGYGQQAEKSSHVIGMAMQGVSMLISSQRWALAQFILQRSPPDSALGQGTKLQLLSRTLPVTGLVCLPLALMLEPGAYTVSNLMQPLLFFRIVVIAGALTAMLYAELKLVNLLSAVAFNVLATVHQIPIVLAGVLLQDNHVDRTSCIGFGCCMLGALVYAVARQNDREYIDK